MAHLKTRLSTLDKQKNPILIKGDSKKILPHLPTNSVQCVITSPPYWSLRDYKVKDQIGLEPLFEMYLFNLKIIFREVKRILKNNGTLWLNMGDCYTSGNRKYRANDKKNLHRGMSYRPDNPSGLKDKDLVGMPWKVAFALQEDGWYLRSEIIWHKQNSMPESVKDRPSRNHEHLFLFSKNDKYYFNKNELINPKGKVLNSVWKISSNNNTNHGATFPEALIKPCILSSTHSSNWILDPFFGIGTLGKICNETNRKFIGVEINKRFINSAIKNLKPKPTIIIT